MEKLISLLAEHGVKPKLASYLGVSYGLVSHWQHGHKPVAPRHCIPIERFFGGAVTRYDIRPDVFCEQRAA